MNWRRFLKTVLQDSFIIMETDILGYFISQVFSRGDHLKHTPLICAILLYIMYI